MQNVTKGQGHPLNKTQVYKIRYSSLLNTQKYKSSPYHSQSPRACLLRTFSHYLFILFIEVIYLLIVSRTRT